MKLAFIDFETYWDDKHTLKKMTPLEYVSHEKTELQACCLRLDGESTVRFGETAIRAQLSRVDWDNTAAVAHNMSGFDALILTRRLGIHPKMFFCTLAMARPIHAKTCGLSLGKLVEHYGIGVKDQTALLETKGKRLSSYSPSELYAMLDYVAADTKQCEALFHILKKHYTPREMWHIDATIRMLVEPRFVCDIPLLEQTLDEERQAKLDALKALARQMMTPDELVVAMFDGRDLEAEVKAKLMSAPRFADLLNSRGVEVPLKVSPSDPKKTIYALARTDEAFIALQDHEDPVVAAAARTRLQVKSTLLETRIEAYLSAARVSDGLLPIPLHYCGADTSGRWSGWLYNPQNPPRIPRDSEGNIIPKRTNALRMAKRAPRGYKVVVADLSGIELRVNLMLWKVPYVMELLAQDPTADLYKPLASEVLGVPIEGMPKMVRQAGKAMHLGCGFGLGSTVKYQAVAKTMAGIEVSTDEAETHIKGYRGKHPEVVGGWRRCHDALHYILLGDRFDIDPWGMCYTERGAIVLPSGRRIRYPALTKTRLETGKTEWTYGCGRHEARIYAGKVDENIVQALARDVLADAVYETFRETGHRTVHSLHDEPIYIIREDEAVSFLEVLQRRLRTPPKWWPELVTWSEGDIADSYGEAK